MVDVINPEINNETEEKLSDETEEKLSDEMERCIEKNMKKGDIINNIIMGHIFIVFITIVINIVLRRDITGSLGISIMSIGMISYYYYVNEIKRDRVRSINLCRTQNLFDNYSKLNNTKIKKKDQTIEEQLEDVILSMILYGHGGKETIIEKCKQGGVDNSNIKSPCFCGDTYCYSDKEEFEKNNNLQFRNQKREEIKRWFNKTKIDGSKEKLLLNNYLEEKEDKNKDEKLFTMCSDIFNDSEKCKDGLLSEYFRTILNEDAFFIVKDTNEKIDNLPGEFGNYCYEMNINNESSLQCLAFPESPCKNVNCKNGECIENSGECDCHPGFYGDKCENSYERCEIQEDCNPENSIDVTGYKKKDGLIINEEEEVETCKCTCADFRYKSPCNEEDLVINDEKKWRDMLEISKQLCLENGDCVSASNVDFGFICERDKYVGWSSDPCKDDKGNCDNELASTYEQAIRGDKSYIECNKCPPGTSNVWKREDYPYCDYNNRPWECPQSYNITDCMCIGQGGSIFSDNKYLDYNEDNGQWLCKTCENNKIRGPLSDILINDSVIPYSYDNVCKCNPYEGFHDKEGTEECIICNNESEYYDETNKQCICRVGYTYNTETETCELEESCILDATTAETENKCVNNAAKENFKINHPEFIASLAGNDEKMITHFFNQVKCYPTTSTSSSQCRCPKNKNGEIILIPDENNDCKCIGEDKLLTYQYDLQKFEQDPPIFFNHTNYLHDSISFECK